jgi:MoxR-like ATPase
MTAAERAAQFGADFARVRAEIQKVIVGQEAIIDGVLTGLLADGHVLLEGVPGLGKTLLVRTLSRVLRLSFSRIQFTPDLMPADIVGTNLITEDETGRRQFQFAPGPVFAHIILADEINRATPKTQSALLEAMQEHSVTVGGTMHRLAEPYIVLATQNPIEMAGTYPLPEAQLDRFLFKLLVSFPNADELGLILDRTTGVEVADLEAVLEGPRVLEMRSVAREIPIASHVRDYAIRLLRATHPDSDQAPPLVRRYVRYGASPRGGQALILAGKVRALLAGRFNVAFEDLQRVAPPALCHRLILNFEGEAEGLSTDAIIDDILRHVPTLPETVRA